MIFLFLTVTFLTSGYLRYNLIEQRRYQGIYFSFTAYQSGLLTSIVSLFSSVVLLYIAQSFSFFASLSRPMSMTVIFLASVIISNLAILFIPKVQKTNELIFKIILWLSVSGAFFVTVGIAFALFKNTFAFFEHYDVFDFIFGTVWSPQTSIRADQVGATGKFGMLPLLTGTLLITFIALSIAFPVGVSIAIYLNEYATKEFRAYSKPVLEILAGVPTVVYGFFAAVTVAPFIKMIGDYYGFTVSSESALAAGIVMGIMIIPYISSLTDDVIHAVPQSLRDGALALGATPYEMISRILLPAAFPGIISAFILGFSRAIGETMIVLMAAGLAGNFTFNPLNSVTTFTVQIGTLLTGDQEFDSLKTLSAFALGSSLFILTFILNIIAVRMIQKYKANYG